MLSARMYPSYQVLMFCLAPLTDVLHKCATNTHVYFNSAMWYFFTKCNCKFCHGHTVAVIKRPAYSFEKSLPKICYKLAGKVWKWLQCIAYYFVTPKLQSISVYLLQHLEGHNAPYVAHSDGFEVGSEIASTVTLSHCQWSSKKRIPSFKCHNI